MKKKYIRFDELASKGKTKTFGCYNIKGGFIIGIIKWNCFWRQYCYFPCEDTVYSAGCIDDISNFIKILMIERTVISGTHILHSACWISKRCMLS